MSLLKDVLKAVAPTLGALVGGPLGASAGKAVRRALGKDDNTPDDAVAEALVDATPEQILALKKEENEAAARMVELGLKADEIDAGDRASARAREIATKDETPRILAFVVTVGFFGLLVFMLLHPIPNQNKDVLNIMLGALGGAWISIIAYYFGSSRGSVAKDATIRTALESK